MISKKYPYLTDEEIKLLKEIEDNNYYKPTYELLEVFDTELPNLGKVRIEKIKTRLGGVKYDIHSKRKYL